MIKKNTNDIIGDRPRDFLACSAVPQPSAPQRSSCKTHQFYKTLVNVGMTQCSKVPIDLYWFNYFNVSLMFLVTFVCGMNLCMQCPCGSRQ